MSIFRRREEPDMSEEVERLGQVMEKTAVVMDGVSIDQRTASTPCPDWDVQRLLAHLVGWSGNFAARAEGVEPNAEPDSTDPGESPAAGFRRNAVRIVTALSQDGLLPEKAPDPGILIAEYILHGWDLAAATGQRISYGNAEAELGLMAMRRMLKPEYRGYGFDAEVTVPDDASQVDKLVAFSGRDPKGWG
jgi:uncharacterized protein (TIGR03086 family)